MIIFPAIDLRRGKCVRLLQGRAEHETVYSDDPLQMALRWQKEGATWLHLVDLDRAMSTVSENRQIAKKIFGTLSIPVQFGGGIRQESDLEEILSAGASRVVIGTAAFRDPGFLKKAVQRYADRIVVGLDAQGGLLATHGWNQVEAMDAVSFAKTLSRQGVQRVVYTDISRDGMLTGPNAAATRQMAEESGLRVIASGGVSSLDDLHMLKPLEPSGVEGVIIGKALYEQKFSLAEALQLCQSAGLE
ncbi:MAG: 1-(5-phosphoribosyl)-5-[(5-phosphoribosylamino)methylideneamino]imidazole-4-carboxamide isomerase [Terriglobia bacterium]